LIGDQGITETRVILPSLCGRYLKPFYIYHTTLSISVRHVIVADVSSSVFVDSVSIWIIGLHKQCLLLLLSDSCSHCRAVCERLFLFHCL